MFRRHIAVLATLVLVPQVAAATPSEAQPSTFNVAATAEAAKPEPEGSAGHIAICAAGAKAGLRPGLNGWIFDSSDLRESFVLPQEAETELARLGRALAASRTHVVALLLPPRGLVAADQVAGSDPPYNPEKTEEEYRQLAERLRATGVDVFDALPAARSIYAATGAYNFPRDHHPTPEAAQAIGAALSAHLREQPEAAALLPSRWKTSRGVERTVPGSRAKELERHCGTDVADTTYRGFRTRQVNPPELGLLDEVPPPQVVMVGTSNLGEKYNLPGFMQEGLSTDVLAVGTDGGGVLGSLDAYLRSAAWVEHPPVFLIWEFYTQGLPERRPGVPDPNVATDYAAVIGAVSGGCTDATAVWHTRIEAVPSGKSVLGRFNPAKAGSDATLQLVFDDVSIPAASVDFEFSKENTVSIEMGPYPRVPTAGRFFYALPALPKGTATFSVSVDGARSGGLTARICPAG